MTAALCAAVASTSCLEGANLAVGTQRNNESHSDALAEQALIGLASISSSQIAEETSYNKLQPDSGGESSQQIAGNTAFGASALSSSINPATASCPPRINSSPNLCGQSKSLSVPSPPQTQYPSIPQPSAKQRQALRRGKWTLEEEAFVARVIQDFNSGYLRAPAGTTLRTYLSEKLNCDPMRITKKFTGDACIGKVRLQATACRRVFLD